MIPGTGAALKRRKAIHITFLHIRLIFAHTSRVFNLPEARLFDYTISCKGCGENIQAPVETIPPSWIFANCPLCADSRLYLPP